MSNELPVGDPQSANGPPPAELLDPRTMRRHCFRLIREVTGNLGWRYKLWIPAAMLLSSIVLLPQWFLRYFTENTQLLSQIDASRFLWMLVGFGVAVAFCQWVAIFLGGILNQWMSLTVNIGLRRDAIKGLNKIRVDMLDTGHRGDWMTRLTSDLQSCEMFLTESLIQQIRQLTILLGTLVLFWYYSGVVAAILIPVALALVGFNMYVQRRMAPTLGKARLIEGDVFQSMIETFEGLRTIRSYQAEEFTLRRINLQLKDLFGTGMRIMKTMAALMGLNQFSSQLVITIVLTFAAYRISGDELTATDALVYPFYINMFLGSAMGLASATYEWNRFFIEGGRLATLLYDESKQVGDRVATFADLEQSVSRVRQLSVESLSVGYGNAPPVIDDFDFTLRAGEIVAIMGPSGCGKSTFLEVFSGLRPAQRGSFAIKLDDQAVRTYPQSPVFVSAFVEQQPYLFLGTIRDNVAFGRADVSDDVIRDALKEVALDEVIHYRGGLDGVLTDRGMNLSVGQRYRLALCRALVSGRPFLFMDEPFAALDVESVERVVDALHKERDRGAGVILITHLLPASLETTRIVEMLPQNPGPPLDGGQGGGSLTSG